EREADRRIEAEHRPERHRRREGIVHVDGADEVPLLALVAEPARGTGVPHPEPALVEARAAAARTAQPERPHEHGAQAGALEGRRDRQLAADPAGGAGWPKAAFRRRSAARFASMRTR